MNTPLYKVSLEPFESISPWIKIHWVDNTVVPPFWTLWANKWFPLLGSFLILITAVTRQIFYKGIISCMDIMTKCIILHGCCIQCSLKSPYSALYLIRPTSSWTLSSFKKNQNRFCFCKFIINYCIIQKNNKMVYNIAFWNSIPMNRFFHCIYESTTSI